MKFKPYSKYKESGIEWLGEVPEHWIALKVGRDMSFMVGWTPSTSNESYYENGEYPWVSIEDMKGRYVSKTKKKLTKKAILEKNAKPVPKGSVLFSFKLSVGKVAFAKNDLYTNEAIASFLPSKNISSDFFYYLAPLFIPKYGRNNLYDALLMNQELIASAKTLVPLYEEQVLIANYLDRETTRIDSLIKEKENFIALLKEKRQALISHTVTKGLDPTVKMKDSGVEWLGDVPEHWSVKKVKHIFEIRKRISGELGHPVLSITQQGVKVKDIVSGKGQLSMDYSKYQFVEVGDFAMNHMDLLTGYVDLSKFHGVTSPDYRVFSLIDNESIDSYYLYLMQMGYKNKIFFSLGQGVANVGRWRLQTESFNEFNIPYPNRNEQKQIADFLDKQTTKINLLVKETQTSIELLKEHRTALISAAVTGKIDVREVA